MPRVTGAAGNEREAARAPRPDARPSEPGKAALNPRPTASERPDAPSPLRGRVGRAVRRLREAAGYSQEAFADAAGVHRTYAGKVERGEVNLSLDSLARLAVPLGVSPAQVLLEAEREP